MTDIYNTCGIGFGPANLALAVALKGLSQTDDFFRRNHFFERKAEFDWHPGMLLDDAEMQISFLKDLATLRDPTSEFTFLNYLRCNGCLEEFANLRKFFPSRVEYRSYLRWAAAKISNCVSYGATVREVRIANPFQVNAAIEVCYERDGKLRTAQCRNLAVGVGGRPRMPEFIPKSIGPKIVHSSDFLPSLAGQFEDKSAEYEFLVIGGGQSSAEMFNHLYTEYPRARVRLAFRRFALHPADDSEFVNEIFSPDHVGQFYEFPRRFRQEFLRAYANTNYAVVDPPLISKIYADLYHDRHFGEGRLGVSRYQELVGASEVGGKVQAVLRDVSTGNEEPSLVDGIFLGTGYDFHRSLECLDGVAKYFTTSDSGEFEFNRDYSLASEQGLGVKIFIHGATEVSHGLSSTLLSMLPYRSADIADSILRSDFSNTDAPSISEVENA